MEIPIDRGFSHYNPIINPLSPCLELYTQVGLSEHSISVNTVVLVLRMLPRRKFTMFSICPNFPTHPAVLSSGNQTLRAGKFYTCNDFPSYKPPFKGNVRDWHF